MQNRKQRQREKRREKRRLEGQLKTQARSVVNNTPISVCKELDKSFLNYAVNETRRELRNGDIEPEREALLKKAIDLSRKLNPIKKGA